MDRKDRILWLCSVLALVAFAGLPVLTMYFLTRHNNSALRSYADEKKEDITKYEADADVKKELKEMYLHLASIQRNQRSIIDLELRNWHYAAKHDPEKRLKRLGMNIGCPECSEWLVEHKKVEEAVTMVTISRYKELIEIEKKWNAQKTKITE